LNRHFPPLEIGSNVASQVVEETRRLEAILTSGIPHYWISRKGRPDPVIGFAWHGGEAAMNLLVESWRWTTLGDARVDPQESILIPISRNSADGVFVPRRCFVPLDQAIRAVQEFAEGTDLPAAVKWEALFQEPGKSQRPVSPRQLHLAFGDE
jgi:hypothetical protein